MEKRVLVSGANGFIAAHTVARLLELGYGVVGTVRDPENAEKTAHLCKLAGAEERLKLVEADLSGENPFAGAVEEVDYVLHMASPYRLNVKDPERELVAPAVRGTLAMLEACKASQRIQRIVLTSSAAAITDEPDPSHVLTEADWNEKSSLTRNPYYYSKTLAERAAWDFYKKQDVAWDLVVINPFVVIGPSLSAGVNTSNQILVDLVKGVYPAIFDLTLAMVDVRDVAEAHVKALTSGKAQGRYFCVADKLTQHALVSILREALAGKNHKLPKFRLDSRFGNLLAYLLSYTQPKGTGAYMRTHLGRDLRFDNSKIQRELGLVFRPLEETARGTVEDLKRWGHI